jgi:hypothetical protein
MRSSTTPSPSVEPQRFRITHPFHPRFGQEFELVAYRYNWGEDRVYFVDEQGRLTAIPASWTSMATRDPFVVLSDGRSYFRVADLIRLAELLDHLKPRKEKDTMTGV